ncbi:nibrin [Trichonephila clavipes]|nr:nibrin [Trichonephila clavipes]
MAQRKHLDDFLRSRIIGRLECGRTQLEVSKDLGIAQSVISRLLFSLQSDFRRTLIWRAPDTRYSQENTTERHCYGGARWLARLCKHCRRMPSIGGYHSYGLVTIFTELESNRACVRYAWLTNCSPSSPSHLSPGTSEGIA